jgi:chromosome segregation ATPase
MSEQLIRWIAADAKIANLKEQMAELQAEITQQEREAQDAANTIRQEMQENGLLEDLIEGEHINYKICFTNPRGSTKCPNPDAVPDDFCKIERKPELTKIKKFLDEGNQVNWATVEFSEPKLTYKLVKK